MKRERKRKGRKKKKEEDEKKNHYILRDTSLNHTNLFLCYYQIIIRADENSVAVIIMH